MIKLLSIKLDVKIAIIGSSYNLLWNLLLSIFKWLISTSPLSEDIQIKPLVRNTSILIKLK